MTRPITLYPKRSILAAFYLVIVLLGIPYWYKSTTVERLPLPSALVAHWAAKSESVFAGFGLEDRREEEKDENVVRFARRYKLAFSLLNEDSSVGNGDGSILHWNIDRLLQQYIDPILDSLRPLHNFTVETSIQYFAPLSIELHPAADSPDNVEGEKNAGTIIEEDDLRVFVNSAKWTIASSVRQEPVLNFILYVPSVPHRPMQIKTNSGAISLSNAFITPQWGGIVIHSPPPSTLSSSTPNLDRSFQLFQVQLKKLFGVPPSTSPHNPKKDDVAMARSGSGGLDVEQVDVIVRRRIREVAKESVDTLVAIIKLSGDIPNMRIGREIQRDMRRSLDELDFASNALPQSPILALSHLSQSLTYASSAYFNPSMLALLYFPDEHKYAVYTPLFGPMMVPLLIAAAKDLIAWKKERKSRRDKLKLL